MNNIKIILVTIILFTISSSCFSGSNEREELSKRIESGIPIGASRSEVEQFLKANSIRYSWSPKFLPALNGEDRDWMIGSIEKNSLIKGKYYVQVYFYFDRNGGNLTGYEVFESYKKTL